MRRAFRAFGREAREVGATRAMQKCLKAARFGRTRRTVAAKAAWIAPAPGGRGSQSPEKDCLLFPRASALTPAPAPALRRPRVTFIVGWCALRRLVPQTGTPRAA